MFVFVFVLIAGIADNSDRDGMVAILGTEKTRETITHLLKLANELMHQPMDQRERFATKVADVWDENTLYFIVEFVDDGDDGFYTIFAQPCVVRGLACGGSFMYKKVCHNVARKRKLVAQAFP